MKYYTGTEVEEIWKDLNWSMSSNDFLFSNFDMVFFKSKPNDLNSAYWLYVLKKTSSL